MVAIENNLLDARVSLSRRRGESTINSDQVYQKSPISTPSFRRPQVTFPERICAACAPLGGDRDIYSRRKKPLEGILGIISRNELPWGAPGPARVIPGREAFLGGRLGSWPPNMTFHTLNRPFECSHTVSHYHSNKHK